MPNVYLYFASLLCNMHMSLFLPFFNNHRFLGLPSFALYHNSTYIAIRPFALLSILVFIKLREKYVLERINLKEWFIFALLMIITTWFEPNFLFGFVPCMLIIMIIDFAKGHCKKVLNYVIFSSTVFPIVFLMLWRQIQLFNENAETVLGFSVFKVWFFYAKNPIIALLQSIAFPMIILLFNYKHLERVHIKRESKIKAKVTIEK